MVRAATAPIMFFALIFAAAPLARAEDAGAALSALADGGTARVVQIQPDDSLTLEDGRKVRLIGLRIPSEQRWKEAAVETLDTLTRGHTIRLRFDARREDRYGHSLAQVVVDNGVWLQEALIARGLARVESFPGDTAMIRRLLADEVQARAMDTGLWSDPRYKVLRAVDIAKNPGPYMNRFEIVEGLVIGASDRSNWSFVNFGADWHTDFTIAIAAADRQAVRQGGVDPAKLAGVHVRVRGWLRDWNGPLIEVDHAEQIEFLSDPAKTANAARP